MLKLEVKRTDLLAEARKRKAALLDEHAQAEAKWREQVIDYKAALKTHLGDVSAAYADAAKRVGSATVTALQDSYGHWEIAKLVKYPKAPKAPDAKPTLNTRVIDNAIRFLTLAKSETVKTTQCELDEFFASCCRTGRR